MNIRQRSAAFLPALKQPGSLPEFLWASTWKEREKERKKSRTFGENFLKDPRYSRVVKLDTGLSYDPDFHKNIRDFARNFDMEIMEIKGSAELAVKSYRAAKNGVIQHALE